MLNTEKQFSIDKIFIIILFILFLAGCGRQSKIKSDNINVNHMKFFSNDFQNQKIMDSKFTCDGADLRPHLAWSDIPDNAKSLALAIFDPDAPGKGWLHYLVVDLPPSNLSLNSSDNLPSGAKEIINDFGKNKYGGPCPPSGTHHYQFTLYALDLPELNPKSYQDFLNAIEGHVLAQQTIVGLYKRQ